MQPFWVWLVIFNVMRRTINGKWWSTAFNGRVKCTRDGTNEVDKFVMGLLLVQFRFTTKTFGDKRLHHGKIKRSINTEKCRHSSQFHSSKHRIRFGWLRSRIFMSSSQQRPILRRLIFWCWTNIAQRDLATPFFFVLHAYSLFKNLYSATMTQNWKTFNGNECNEFARLVTHDSNFVK